MDRRSRRLDARGAMEVFGVVAADGREVLVGGERDLAVGGLARRRGALPADFEAIARARLEDLEHLFGVGLDLFLIDDDERAVVPQRVRDGSTARYRSSPGTLRTARTGGRKRDQRHSDHARHTTTRYK